MKCDFEPDKNLTCIKQEKMYRKWYVLTFDYKWVKREDCHDEFMSDNTDWCHVHNSKACTEVKKYYEGLK